MSAQAATSGPSPAELRGAALECAARGVPVLPLRGKLPLIPAAHGPGDPLYQQCRGQCGNLGHGVHDATTDPDQLREWWDRWPHANVGLRTGIGFDVIDVDGAQGRRSMERWLAEHGGGVPIGGPRVRTGSGGWHLYVAPTGLPDRIGVLPSVDYRAADRYVVAPPSRHPTTSRRYLWTPGHGLDTPLGQIPAALRDRLTPRPVERRPAPAPATVRPAEPGHPYGRAVLEAETARIASARAPGQGRGGQRNQVLWEAARNLYNLVAGGVLDQAEVDHELERAAGACGLLRDEPRQTQRTLASARQVGLAHPRGIPDRQAPAGGRGPARPGHKRMLRITSRFGHPTATVPASADQQQRR
jgi:Bifunctional DNA primase/polymerase, N-terminal